MTYATIAHRNFFSAEGIRAAVQKFGAYVVKRHQFRMTMQEMQALTDRDLADLGISRSEIRRLAWEAAYGEQP